MSRELGVDNIRNYEEELIEMLDNALRNMRGVTVTVRGTAKEKPELPSLILKKWAARKSVKNSAPASA
jgi:hypothetical protein